MSTRVFIGRLPLSARESDVERFFKGFGKIREVTLKDGFGFVELTDRQDAEDAVYELNGRDLCGERVIVDHARTAGERRGGGGGRGGGRGGYGGYGGYGGGGGFRSNGPRFDNRYRQTQRNPPQHSEHRVRVSNLSSRVSWQDLKDYMRQAGDVVYADAHRVRPNEGIVEFACASDLKNAIESLHETELKGRRISVIEDRGRNDRNKRSPSRSYSRSRSRSASRSRSRSRSRSGRRSRSRSFEDARRNDAAGGPGSRSRSPSPSQP